MNQETERLLRVEEGLARLRWQAIRIEVLAWFVAVVVVSIGFSATETSFNMMSGILIAIAAVVIVSLLLFTLTHIGRLPSNDAQAEEAARSAPQLLPECGKEEEPADE